MKSSIKYLIIITLTLLTACGGEGKISDSPEVKRKQLENYRKDFAELKSKIDKLEKELASNQNVDPKDLLRKVEVLPLVATTFEHFVEVQGNVKSDKNVMLHPEVSGVILKLNVQEGQDVRQGQVIAEIDAELLRKNMEEIKKRLELATTVFQRQENLWKQKIGSEVQYLQAKNEKESLEKSLESMQAQVNKAIVRSPIDGTIDEFFANPGEMANPGMPMVRIVNLARVEIAADVSEAYLRKVKKGDTVTVTFPVLAIEKQKSVDVVGQFINPENRTFRIEMRMDNPDRLLKPNIMALVKINDFYQENAISVPSFLIQNSTSGEKFLFKVVKEEGHDVVKRTVVETGMVYQGQTHIKSGLMEGDRLITKGYNEVVNGEKVNIVGQSSNLTVAK